MYFTDTTENAALEEAVKTCDVDAVRELLEQGVDPNCGCVKFYSTVMQLALRNKDVEIIKLLVRYGAEVNWDLLDTIFELESFQDSKELVYQILQYNQTGLTIQKIFMKLVVSSCNGKIAAEILEMLVGVGLRDVGYFDGNGSTPLIFSVLFERMDFVS